MATRFCSTLAWNRVLKLFKKWRENDNDEWLRIWLKSEWWTWMISDNTKDGSTGWDGDVDAEIAVVGEQLRDRGVEDEAVRVHDGWRYALVDGPRRGLPRQSAAVAV